MANTCVSARKDEYRRQKQTGIRPARFHVIHIFTLMGYEVKFVWSSGIMDSNYVVYI